MNVDRLQQIPFSGASQFESGVCHLERPPIQDIVFKTKIRTDEKPLQVYPQKNFVMGERKNQNQKNTNHLRGFEKGLNITAQNSEEHRAVWSRG